MHDGPSYLRQNWPDARTFNHRDSADKTVELAESGELVEGLQDTQRAWEIFA
jgi:hypothetical protein